MSIDQVTWRRTRKLGLTAHDASRAFQGYTLYTPAWGDGGALTVGPQNQPATATV